MHALLRGCALPRRQGEGQGQLMAGQQSSRPSNLMPSAKVRMLNSSGKLPAVLLVQALPAQQDGGFSSLHDGDGQGTAAMYVLCCAHIGNWAGWQKCWLPPTQQQLTGWVDSDGSLHRHHKQCNCFGQVAGQLLWLVQLCCCWFNMHACSDQRHCSASEGFKNA